MYLCIMYCEIVSEISSTLLTCRYSCISTVLDKHVKWTFEDFMWTHVIKSIDHDFPWMQHVNVMWIVPIEGDFCLRQSYQRVHTGKIFIPWKQTDFPWIWFNVIPACVVLFWRWSICLCKGWCSQCKVRFQAITKGLYLLDSQLVMMRYRMASIYHSISKQDPEMRFLMNNVF